MNKIANDCIFCKLLESKEENFIFENDLCYAVFDKHPFTPGHFLIISKEHYNDLNATPFHIASKIYEACYKLVGKIKDTENCSGVSIFQNNSPHTKTHINHLHFHIVPFYSNDVLPIPRLEIDKNNERSEIHELIKKSIYSNSSEVTIQDNITETEILSWINMVNKNLFQNKILYMGRESEIHSSTSKIWLERINTNQDIISIALLNGNVIGGAHVSRYADKKSHCGKASLLIDENFRNEGLGFKLISQLINSCHKKGIERIEIEPAIENTSAIKLFLKLGFKVEGIQHEKLKTKSDRKLDCLSMYKIIN